jgi:hypothetical protein
MEQSMQKEQSINVVIDEIIALLDSFRGDNDYFDDISILGMEFH